MSLITKLQNYRYQKENNLSERLRDFFSSPGRYYGTKKAKTKSKKVKFGNGQS